MVFGDIGVARAISRSISAFISAICSVARGSAVGGRQPRAADVLLGILVGLFGHLADRNARARRRAH